MELKKITSKKSIMEIIKKVIRIGVFTALITILVIIFMIVSIITDGYSKDKMEKYESKESRINYFNDHKDEFQFFIDFFEKNPSIELIDHKSDMNVCGEGEFDLILSNKVHICSKEKINVNSDDDKKIVDKFSSLNDMYSIKKRIGEDDELAAISFYLVLALNGKIHYNYCLSSDSCDSEDDYYANDRGKFEKNKIDDKWSSIYDTLYTI